MSTTKPLRLMVVEDEGVVRQDFAQQLRDHGHTVVEAADGEQALKMLREPDRGHFDGVLLDLAMPGMSGFEFMHRAINEGRLKCPVIIVSAYTNVLANGLPRVAAVLSKPMDTDRLAEKVETALADEPKESDLTPSGASGTGDSNGKMP